MSNLFQGFCLFVIGSLLVYADNVRLSEATDPKILGKTQEQSDLWGEDARRDWKMATATLVEIAGSDAVVLQCGLLRAEYNTGSLIFIYTSSPSTKDKLIVLRVPRWGWNYEILKWDKSDEKLLKSVKGKIITWMKNVVKGNVGDFKEGERIEAPKSTGPSRMDGTFVVEICGEGKCFQFIEPKLNKMHDPTILELYSWLMIYANSWKPEFLEKNLGLKYNQLPIIDD